MPHKHFIRFLDYFNRDCLLVTSAEAIGEILAEKDHIFKRSAQFRFIFGRYVGHGIAVVEGRAHKAQRRALSLAFSARHVRDLYPLFWAKGSKAVRAIEARAAEQEAPLTIECHDWAVRCALDAMGTAGMGMDFGTIDDDKHMLVQAYERLKEFSWQDAVVILVGTYMPERIATSLPLRRNRVVDSALADIRTVCRDAIRAKQNAMAFAEKSAHVNICSAIVNSGMFSEDEAVEQLMSMLFASHHAPGRTLTAAVYALCRFPEKQRRLREEVHRCLPSVDNLADGVSSAHIEGMPYLNAFCKEVLRKYSTGVSSRQAASDTTVQGTPIPKGTTIKLSVMSANGDPMLWGSDVGEFKPERWLPGGGKETVAGADEDKADGEDRTALGGAASNFANLTFMHGPRNCIAAQFAHAELACLLATWVGRFEFTLEDEELMDESKLRARALETKLNVCVRVVNGWS
jgi:cytochrome P450